MTTRTFRRSERYKIKLAALTCLTLLAFTYSTSTVTEDIQVIWDHLNNHYCGYTEWIADPPRVTQTYEPELSGTGDCYSVSAVRGYRFTSYTVVHLPRVGTRTVTGSTASDGLVTQQFADDTSTHETWHRRIYEAYKDNVWAALESWSDGYTSNNFETSEAAFAAGYSDMAAAYNLARSYVSKHAALQSGPNHPRVGAGVYNGVWQAIFPNWGASSLADASKFKPKFKKQKGTCK